MSTNVTGYHYKSYIAQTVHYQFSDCQTTNYTLHAKQREIQCSAQFCHECSKNITSVQKKKNMKGKRKMVFGLKKWVGVDKNHWS